MKIFLDVSRLIVPFVIFGIVTYGIIMRVSVYDSFVKGARNGFFTVIKIMPTLIGLMVAVGILRASGFLDFLSGKNVFVFGCHRTSAGYFQRIWNRFLYWTDRVYQYVLYRNYFLYNERLLYGSQSDKD